MHTWQKINPFLSTLSLRRATSIFWICRMFSFISIHALLAESDGAAFLYFIPKIDFYPRSPCGERPQISKVKKGQAAYFYPRSPCGERRWLRCWQLAARDISIHALLAESDEPATSRNDKHNIFLSTLSLRRATRKGSRRCVLSGISIHALLAESDSVLWMVPSRLLFLSTLSLRRATQRFGH